MPEQSEEHFLDDFLAILRGHSQRQQITEERTSQFIEKRSHLFFERGWPGCFPLFNLSRKQRLKHGFCRRNSKHRRNSNSGLVRRKEECFPTSGLKIHLQSDLNQARGSGGGHMAERRTADVAIHGTATVELRVIEYVKTLQAQVE